MSKTNTVGKASVIKRDRTNRSVSNAKVSSQSSKKKMFARRWHSPSSAPRSGRLELDSDALRIFILGALPGKTAQNLAMYFGDEKYFCPPLEDVKEILKNSSLDRKTWVEERFDCDDFAYVLKAQFCEAAYKDGDRRTAHCFGIVWGNLPDPHAINWVVVDEAGQPVFKFIEPQNSRIFDPRKSDRDIYFMLA